MILTVQIFSGLRNRLVDQSTLYP